MGGMPQLVDSVLAPGSLARLTQPTLDAGDFVLRPWAAADADAVAQAHTDPAIQHWHARSMTRDEADAWVARWPQRWQAETGAGWAIAGDGLLGQISLRRIDLAEGDGEISYWVLPSARGRRVASRALEAMTRWAFAELGLHRIEVRHSTRNEPSCKVAERAGYAYEGTLRSQALHADGWHDMHLHARIAG